MAISFTDAAVLVELSLASGRIAYSVTRDDIFRPVREWVYMRSAPDSDTILVRDEAGDHEYPARSFHAGLALEQPDLSLPLDEAREKFMAQEGRRVMEYMPQLPPREPGWAGCLIECPYCFSFWTSLGLALLWLAVGSDVAAVLLAPFAIWAIANAYAVKGI